MPPDQLEPPWECWGHLETPVTSLLGALLRGKDSAGLSTREAHSFKSIYPGKVWAVRQQVRLFLQRHFNTECLVISRGCDLREKGQAAATPISVQQLETSHRKISSRAWANDCFLHERALGLVRHRSWNSPTESGQLLLFPSAKLSETDGMSISGGWKSCKSL